MKIPGDVIRIYQTLHTWTGITCAAILFIAFYAGALTMFKPVINQWATPPGNYLAPISDEKLDNLIAQVQAKHSGATKGFEITRASELISTNHSPITW